MINYCRSKRGGFIKKLFIKLNKLSYRQRLSLLCIGIIVLTISVQSLFGQIESTTITKAHVSEKTESQQDLSVEELKQKGYPSELIEYTEKYPETRNFVINYKENAKIYNSQEIDISDEVQKNVFPLFLQWDYRWGYRTYGSGYFAPRGCGPTCMAMVYAGLTGKSDQNPYKLGVWAKNHGYYVDGVGTYNSFLTDSAQYLGLKTVSIGVSKNDMIKYLKNGYAIIANVKAGDFTTSGHYIVITGIDNQNKLQINDPNSINNSSKSWDIDRVYKQVKNMVAYGI